MENPIYKVSYNTESNAIPLGYFTGNETDIRIYFHDQSYYGLNVDPIKVVHITNAQAVEREGLTAEKLRIEKRLAEIKQKIE